MENSSYLYYFSLRSGFTSDSIGYGCVAFQLRRSFIPSSTRLHTPVGVFQTQSVYRPSFVEFAQILLIWSFFLCLRGCTLFSSLKTRTKASNWDILLVSWLSNLCWEGVSWYLLVLWVLWTFSFSLPSLYPRSLLPVPQLPGSHVRQWHCSPGPGLPEDAEDQPHALHRCPVIHLPWTARLCLQSLQIFWLWCRAIPNTICGASKLQWDCPQIFKDSTEGWRGVTTQAITLSSNLVIIYLHSLLC